MKNTLHTERKDRQSKTEYWNRHIENWHQSGLTQVEYCRKNNLNKHTFLYWKTKWNKTETIHPLLPVSILQESPSAPSSISSGISISVNNRFDVNLNVNFDRDTLFRLIDVLERQ